MYQNARRTCWACRAIEKINVLWRSPGRRHPRWRSLHIFEVLWERNWQKFIFLLLACGFESQIYSFVSSLFFVSLVLKANTASPIFKKRARVGINASMYLKNRRFIIQIIAAIYQNKNRSAMRTCVGFHSSKRWWLVHVTVITLTLTLILEKPLPLFIGRPNRFILTNGKHPYCSIWLSNKTSGFFFLNGKHRSSLRAQFHGALLFFCFFFCGGKWPFYDGKLHLVSITNISPR